MRGILTALVGVAALGVGYFGVQTRGTIEAGIEARAEGVLAQMPTARVSIDQVRGRVVALSGRVASEAEADTIKDEIADEWGVRRVDMRGVDVIPFIKDASDYAFSASRVGDEISVTGYAADEDTAARLVALSRDAIGAQGGDVSIALADPQPEGWVQSVSAGLAQFDMLDGGATLLTTGEGAVLSGTATNADDYHAVQAFPQVMAAEGDIPGELGDIRLALSPFTFAAAKDGNVLSLDGGVPNDASIADLEAYVGETYPEMSLSSALLASDGVPRETWNADAQASIDAVMSYETGNALLLADQVRLSGELKEGADQVQTLEDAQGRFARDLVWDASGANGAYFTDRDRARRDLFSTIEGEETMVSEGGFILPVPGFELSPSECQAQLTRLTTENPLRFVPGTSALTPEGNLSLDAAAGIQIACAEAMSGWETTANGHTLSVEAGGEALSLARADAVIAGLEARGADISALMPAGRGASVPSGMEAAAPVVVFSYFNRAEADRLAAEQRAAEAARLAEEQRLAEEARVAEEARLAEEARVAELARQQREALGRAIGGTAGSQKINGFELPIPLFVPSAAMCEETFASVLATEKVNFATGSADLDTASLAVVDTLAGVARHCADTLGDTQVEIGGHTDSQGDDANNMNLSIARAQSVVDALVARGVNTGSYIANGYGETVAKGDNSTAEGRAVNRRIEFTLIEMTPDTSLYPTLILEDESLTLDAAAQ